MFLLGMYSILQVSICSTSFHQLIINGYPLPYLHFMLKFVLDPLSILLFINHNIAYTPPMCQSHYLLSSGDI